MGGQGATISIVGWKEAAEGCLSVRTRVFVEEQAVPIEIEVDGRDPECVHALALDGTGLAVGTGRLLPNGHLGRMAVLPSWRGRGVGIALLRALETEAARRGHRRIVLNAQVSARGFYEGVGYRVRGPVFEEAGIPHVVMERSIEPS